MTDKSTETKLPADIDSIYDESIIFSKPVMKRTVTKPEWLNIKTDISDNNISEQTLNQIPHPILRRQSPLLYERHTDYINTSQSLIDIIDEHDIPVNNIPTENQNDTPHISNLHKK
tara:strand:- start:96 stop:443 length:348 start_codon:yes stop_codon:yes gene_type:complete